MAYQTSTGFIPWDRILDANKDSAKKQSDKMATGLEAKGQGVKKKLAGAQAGFGAAVTAGNPAAKPPTPVAPGAVAPRASSGQAAPINSFGQPTAAAPKVQGGTPAPASPVPPAQAATPAAPGAAPSAPPPQQGPYQYTGPNSLGESASGWEALLGEGRDADSRIGAAQSEGGLEALLQDEAQGGYTGGQSRLDAALLGATGRGRFQQLQKEYGGLLGQLTAADADSRKQADAARGSVAEANAEAARVAAERKAKLDADSAAQTEKEKFAQDNADEAMRRANQITGTGKDASGKAVNYKDYVTTNNFESTVRDVGEALNPVAWILKATGNKTIEEMRTPEYEKSTGGNSNKVRFNQRLPMATEMELAELYSGMTQDELTALERMPRRAQDEWLRARYVAMKQKREEERKKAMAEEDRQRVRDQLGA